MPLLPIPNPQYQTNGHWASPSKWPLYIFSSDVYRNQSNDNLPTPFVASSFPQTLPRPLHLHSFSLCNRCEMKPRPETKQKKILKNYFSLPPPPESAKAFFFGLLKHSFNFSALSKYSVIFFRMLSLMRSFFSSLKLEFHFHFFFHNFNFTFHGCHKIFQ